MGAAWPAPAVAFAAVNVAACALLAREAPAKLAFAAVALLGLGLAAAARHGLASGRARSAPTLGPARAGRPP